MRTIFLVYTTSPSLKAAETLAEGLVKNKLAVCVNILPQIISIYQFNDALERNSEVSMFIKTSVEKKNDVIRFVEKNHPYSVPAILAFETVSNESFFSYVTNSLE